MPELSKDEFIEIYHKYLGPGTKYVEAYHLAEAEHLKRFGRRKYSNYQSFRQVVNRLNKV